MTKAFSRTTLVRLLIGVAVAVLAFNTAKVSQAQDFPNRPVRIVVGAAAGGGFDTMARLLAAQLQEKWRQPVLVVNKPGAGHVIATQEVARAEPDGYTLLVVGANYTLNPSLHKKLSYDTLKDFAPVTTWAKTPFVLVVNSSTSNHSVKDLIAYAKANPGKLNYTASQLNSSSHLVGEMLKSMTGVDMQFVPFAGSAPALMSVLANDVQLMIDSTGSALPHIKSGKLRPLAVTSLTRDPVLPDVPTLSEAGFPGFEVVAWGGVVAPANTPRGAINILVEGFREALANPKVRSALPEQGWQVYETTPAEMQKFVVDEINKYRPIIESVGLRAD